MTKWFYHLNTIVKGPVSPQELQNLISTFDRPDQTFVWSRGRTDWISADRWKPDLVAEDSENNTFSAVNTSQLQNHTSIAAANLPYPNPSLKPTEKPNLNTQQINPIEQQTTINLDIEKFKSGAW